MAVLVELGEYAVVADVPTYSVCQQITALVVTVRRRHLLVLLIGLAAGDLASPGVVGSAARGVDGLALVQPAGDLAPARRIGQDFAA
ncbi:hypothetical protein ADK74_14095 [Streptomyces decoyicus]|nr:hypothetical protein ADK74_14095 [Streptomyces decoyicus]